MKVSFIVCFILTLTLFSCRQPITSKEKLTQYLENKDNGLKKEQEVNKIDAVLIYMPWQALAARQRGSANIKEQEKSTKYLKNKLFFVLSLSYNNKELLRQLDYDLYSEMVQVLSFRMNEFVELIPDDGKSIEPESCQFQQTYGMSKANNLLIAFNEGRLLSAKRVSVRIKEFGLNMGDLNYTFKTKDIKDIPAIASK